LVAPDGPLRRVLVVGSPEAGKSALMRFAHDRDADEFLTAHGAP
jgi:hypothetical protein